MFVQSLMQGTPAISINKTQTSVAGCYGWPRPIACPEPTSHFRRVFQTSDQMKSEFVKFLKTIFYQLDEKKVLTLMAQLLEDPNKSDEQVYNELLQRIHETKKSVPILSRLWSLFVLKKGMQQQTTELMKNFNGKKFHDYMEIYDRRYLHSLQKTAALDGATIAICNTEAVGIADRIQAGAIFSKFPYKTHVPLNDSDCKDPLMETEKTYRPVGSEIPDHSVDMIACLGGFHHAPAERVDAFIDSLHSKLRPGGVIFLREHNVTDKAGSGNLSKKQLISIASVVHSFVNAADGVKWSIEQKEIREFKSVEEWKQMMMKHGFTPLSKQALVLKDDPTENAMFAFVKEPKTLDELKQAIAYRNDCTRPKEGTRATWIEWGNVRFSKQYANYIQNHHAYSFDFIGHIRQHWKHFYHFFKESLNDKEVSLGHSLFCDAMVMNLFIVIATTIQCSFNSFITLPSRTIARWKYGSNWRNVCHLTEVEKFEAKCEKEYSDDLDHTPYYMQKYVGKIKEMWKVLWNSKEHWSVKVGSTFSAISNTIGFLAKAATAVPVRAISTQEAFKQPDTVKMLIKDPSNEINKTIKRWEREKNPELDKNNKIEIIHHTPDGYKLISVPRYRPFTKIFSYLNKTKSLEVLEIGSQKEISVDLLLKDGVKNPVVEGARQIYELDNLQDPEKKRYVTYQVNVCALKHFQKMVGPENIHYIHE